MNLLPTWKDFLNSRDTNADGNKSPGSYLSAWDNDETPEAKIALLTNNPNLAILSGEAGNGIIVLHSFKNLGGTIFSPAKKIVCLIGTNKTAPVVIINEVALADTSNFVTPSAEDILACTGIEELLNLTAPLVEDNEDTTNFNGTNTFLPCPWLLDTIINARTDDPFKLILAVNEGAALFNTTQHETILNYMPNTAQTVEQFVMWAWGTKKGLIPPTTFFFDPNDEDADTYHIARHQQCIQLHAPLVLPLLSHAAGLPHAGPVPPGGVAPLFNQTANEAVLQQLVHSISRQSDEAAAANDLMTRQLEFNLEKDDKKKDRIKKLHQAVKQLILFASADDADSVPDEPWEIVQAFPQCRN